MNRHATRLTIAATPPRTAFRLDTEIPGERARVYRIDF
jgi:hypothetical protein